MNISFEYYHIFYYAAKYKNLTQAAEALHSSQPNISRTIKLLENELGCDLMIRSNRGITLTPEGEKLYSHVRIAVEQIQAAEESIQKSIGLQEGIVTIGASETALHMILLPILSRFKKQYPHIHIRISNHLTGQAILAVQNGLVDFAVVATPADISKPLVSHPVMEFQDILVCGPSYARLQERSVSLKELHSYPMVCLSENTVTYRFYENLFRSHGLTLKPELEAATTDQILSMIRSDLGIGFIPEVFAKEALMKNEVFRIPLTETLPERHICFIENENHPLNLAAAALKKAIVLS